MPPHFAGVLPEGIDNQPDDPFAKPEWLDHCRCVASRMGIVRSSFLADTSYPRWRKLLSYVANPARAARHLLAGAACPRYLLPAAAMIHDVFLRQGSVSVLDVGGGFGDNYFQLLSFLPKPVQMSYRVVDNEVSCQLGRSVFSGYNSDLKFFTEPPADSFDIVLVVGTLQYLPHWRASLKTFFGKARSYLYVARSPIAIAADSYTTEQSIKPMYGSHAKQIIGTTKINIVGLSDLKQVLPRPSIELWDTDYSDQFASLPRPWSDVRYINLGWDHTGSNI